MGSQLWLYIAIGFFCLIIVAALVLAYSLYADYTVVKSRKVAAPSLGPVQEKEKTIDFSNTTKQERDDTKPKKRILSSLRKPKAETIQVNPIWGHQDDQEMPEGQD